MARKHSFKTILRFIISFGAIGIILYLFREQLPAVYRHLQKANPVYFVAAVLVFLIGLISVAVRLQFVLKVHAAKLSVLRLYYMNLVALFFNNVLPSHMGGEMVKAYYIYKGANDNVATFSAVVVDRLFGLITMAIIGISAFFIFDQASASPRLLNSIIILTSIIVIIFVIIFNGRIVSFLCSVNLPFLPAPLLDKLREIYQAMYAYRGHKNLFIGCILLTIIGQVTYVFVNYLLANSLGMDIPFGFFCYFIPVLLLLGMAPSINGIGVREATFLFYLTGLTTPDKALALSLLTTFFMIFVGLFGGIIYAFVGGLPSLKEAVEYEG